MNPVIIFIPGMLNDERIYTEIIQMLPNTKHHVLDVTHQSSIKEMALSAWSLIATLPRETPVILCGFSMGGYVALNMLTEMQFPIASAVLISTSARSDTEKDRTKRQQTIAYLKNKFSTVLNNVVTFSLHQVTEKNKQLVINMGETVGAETAIRQTSAIMERPNLVPLLKSINIPISVLCGAEDKITPFYLSEELAALSPKAALAIVSECGHMLPLEKPEVVVELLQKQLIETNN